MATKNIFDMSNVKGVTAICLLDKETKKHVGKIIANWSDNPNGTVCTAQVMLWDGKISSQIKTENIEGLEGKFKVSMIGKAGGYGYDKLSSAIASALSKGGILDLIKVEGASGNQREAFEKAGFEYIEIV